MTVTELRAVPERVPEGPGRPSPARRLGEHACVLAVLAWWAGPLTTRIGGRGPGAVSVGLLLLGPALLTVRPWSRRPATATWLVVWLGLAALLVCALSPTGWYGGNDAASYVYGGVLGLVVLGYARTPQRRELVAGFVVLAGLAQFAQAFLPWWGGGNPAAIMTGTFYWWNPYAVYLLPAALCGAAAVAWWVRPYRVLGAVTFPLCLTGIVLSTSRATMACLLAGVLSVAVLSTRGPGWGPRLGRMAGLGALSAAVLTVATGPVFFGSGSGGAGRSGPLGALAGTAARAQGQSLADNGGYRLQFWQQALNAARHHLLTGGGYHSLASSGARGTPATWARSNLAHNGYLQALGDGGLLLALPVAVLTGLLLVALARALRNLLRRVDRPGPEHWLAVGVPVATLGLLAHSAVDFDWSHPADLGLTAILAGLVWSLRAPQAELGGRPRPRAWLAGAALLAVTGAAWGVGTEWDRVGTAVQRAQGASSPTGQLDALVSIQAMPLGDLRLQRALMSSALTAGASPLRPRDGVALVAALGRTRAAGRDDLHLALLRARVEALLGRRVEALAEIDRVEGLLGAYTPPYADVLAQALVEAGRPDRARDLQARLIRQQGGPADGWSRVGLLVRLFGRDDVLARCAAGYTPGSPPAVGGPWPTSLVGAACDRLEGGA